jgi:hypothetical protein
MPAFETALNMLKTYGIFEFYLPFLLVFTMFFGLLEKVQPFGKEQKRLNVIIAAIAGFYVMVFSPMAITITSFFSDFFAKTSITIVTLLVGMMIVGLLAGPFWEKKDKENKIAGVIILIGVIVGAALFLNAGGLALFTQIAGDMGFGIDGETMVILIMVGLTVVAIWYMTREPKMEKSRTES